MSDNEPTEGEFHALLRSLATTPEARAFCEKLIAAAPPTTREDSTMNENEPPVFVFGSNERGAHGRGAALFAKQYRGAFYGQSVGRQGNSYAIPTKDAALKPLPLHEIGLYVAAFLAYAEQHTSDTFELTPIGCGLAGYKPEQIAPMFADAPANVLLPVSFVAVLRGAL